MHTCKEMWHMQSHKLRRAKFHRKIQENHCIEQGLFLPNTDQAWPWKEIKSVNPKGNQPWIFIESTNAEAEAPIIWPPDDKSWLIGEDPDVGKDWRQKEKEVVEDEMVR